MRTYFLSVTKKIILFLLLFAGVLLVNFPILRFDMLYFEQPLLYLVNQQITSLHDLFAIYLHPRILDVNSIPFFRPSGHVLIYQILAPILGWHNTRGFLSVNFLFLAATGFMLAKVYALLFPRYKIGGYIAFAFYVMHPALMLSRLTAMHFEFAQTFFLMWSFYCFVRFCRENDAGQAVGEKSFSHTIWLVMTLLFYVIAVTFKETAILLGPVLISYFCLTQRLSFTKKVIELLALLTVVTVTLAVYVMLSWGQKTHPLGGVLSVTNILTVFNKFLEILFGFPFVVLKTPQVAVANLTWDIVIFPLVGRVLTWFLLVTAFLGLVRLLHFRSEFFYKKSVLFLIVATLLFLALPVFWVHVAPWHTALALLFLAMLLGFGFEFLMNSNSVAGSVLIICLGLATLLMADMQVRLIQQSLNGFELLLNRNAVLQPPPIKQQLNADSVVVAEDSANLRDDYVYGNSIYPLIGSNHKDVKRVLADNVMYSYPLVYGGTLFKWAYLLPHLKEQTYPFQIANMDKIRSDEVIYNWLQHFNNIFCLGYDAKGVWHDRTLAFKKQLWVEKLRRRLVVNAYEAVSGGLSGNVLRIKRMGVPDSQLCKFECDKDAVCKGVTYLAGEAFGQAKVECYFYSKVFAKSGKCSGCESFVKGSVIPVPECFSRGRE